MQNENIIAPTGRVWDVPLSGHGLSIYGGKDAGKSSLVHHVVHALSTGQAYLDLRTPAEMSADAAPRYLVPAGEPVRALVIATEHTLADIKALWTELGIVPKGVMVWERGFIPGLNEKFDLRNEHHRKFVRDTMRYFGFRVLVIDNLDDVTLGVAQENNDAVRQHIFANLDEMVIDRDNPEKSALWIHTRNSAGSVDAGGYRVTNKVPGSKAGYEGKPHSIIYLEAKKRDGLTLEIIKDKRGTQRTVKHLPVDRTWKPVEQVMAQVMTAAAGVTANSQRTPGLYVVPTRAKKVPQAIEYLSGRAGEFVRSAELAPMLGLKPDDRDGVSYQMKKLRKHYPSIEAKPRHGYRMPTELQEAA